MLLQWSLQSCCCSGRFLLQHNVELHVAPHAAAVVAAVLAAAASLDCDVGLCGLTAAAGGGAGAASDVVSLKNSRTSKLSPPSHAAARPPTDP